MKAEVSERLRQTLIHLKFGYATPGAQIPISGKKQHFLFPLLHFFLPLLTFLQDAGTHRALSALQMLADMGCFVLFFF